MKNNPLRYIALLVGFFVLEDLNGVVLTGHHIAQQEDRRGVATLLEHSVNDQEKPAAKAAN
jgi:hypothetical protein